MSMSSSISRFLVLCQAEFLTNLELRGLVKPADQRPGFSCLCLFSTRIASIQFLCEHWGLKMDGYLWVCSK